MSLESGPSDTQSEPLFSQDASRLIVQEVATRARDTAGSAPKLANELAQIGFSGEKGPYSESGISNWIQGRTTPPADVFLGLLHLAAIPLNETLGIKVGVEINEPLRHELDVVRSMVTNLYQHIGLEMPDMSSLQAPDHTE